MPYMNEIYPSAVAVNATRGPTDNCAVFRAEQAIWGCNVNYDKQ